ncbi:MAG: type III-A CRISPR-associated protein Cas10/Csm1 [bacterium]
MDDRNSVILSALLHDVGKLGQRGHHGEDDLSQAASELGQDVHPEAHRHVLWTSEFINRHFQAWPTEIDVSRVSDLACHHHHPQEDDGAHVLIDVANNLSGGGVQPGEDIESLVDDERQPLLRPVFLRVWGAAGRAEEEMVYDLSPLRRDDLTRAFPVRKDDATSQKGAGLLDSYRQLWDHLIEAANATRAETPEALIAHLLCLLETYGWSVPNSFSGRMNDFSLYDHSRITAAVAAALFDYHTAADNMMAEAIRNHEESKFILLAGDLSGIQPYIFQLAEVGIGATAKRLRARSFYAQCLTETACHRVLRAFALPPCNVIMQSGGRFYALLPDVPDAPHKLASLEQEFDTWCHRELLGQIAINLAWTRFKPSELQAFSDVLRRLHDELSRSKHRPSSRTLMSEDAWQESAFVVSNACAPEEGMCRICGKAPAEPEDDADGEAERCCRRCRDDREMGRLLPRTRYITFCDDPETGHFSVLGHSFDLTTSEHIEGSPYLVLALGADDVASVSRFPVAHRFLARHVPVADTQSCGECPAENHCSIPQPERPRPGRPLFFQCIGAQSRGRGSIGYLKGDVDHLGKTFCFGLPTEQRSVSRLVALSRSLDLFFSGYIETLVRSEFPFVYTVFSGGDDFLLIGPWDTIVDLAQRIHDDFARFSCGRLTLSAGVTLGRPRTPVATAVDSVAGALERSKENAAVGALENRNQLTAFGTTVKWSAAARSIDEAQQLADWLTEGVINTSACQRLMTYSELYRRFTHTGETRHLRFVPLLAYDLARNWPEPDDKQSEKRAARAWAEGLRKGAMKSGQADTEPGPWAYLRFVLEYALNTRR